MEIPVSLRKSPHKIAEEKPEAVRTYEFWNKVKPVEFLEENPKRALELAGDAIASGITHKNIDDVVRRAIGAQNFQDVAVAMGAHKRKRVAEYLLRNFIISEQISHEQLARTLADVAPPDKTIHVIAKTSDPELRKELLAKYRERILSDPDAVKKIAKYPHIIEHILEAEWHANMDEKQLKILSNALSRESPAEMARIIANTLRYDIKTPKAAKSTVIILKNIMSGAANNPAAAEELLRTYGQIKKHVFPETGGKNVEFGKTFLNLAGEEAVMFLAKAAQIKQSQKKYDQAADILREATWLAKEYLKHVKHEDAEESTKKRVMKYLQGIIKLTDPSLHSNIEFRRRKEIKNQLRRLVEELSDHNILRNAGAQHITSLGRNLASIHDHRIILPVVERIARDPTSKNHNLLLKAYLGAYTHSSHARGALQEILGLLEEEKGQELSDGELRNIVQAINIRDYIPDYLWNRCRRT